MQDSRRRGASALRFGVSIVLLVTLAFMTLVLPGCKADVSKFGGLKNFAYSYGSFNGGQRDFTITEASGDDVRSEGRYLFVAKGYNGVDLDVEVFVGQDVLDDIAAIIADNGIAEWDGFDEVDRDILDGYSFLLAAQYESGTIQASGYMKYPNNYEQGHAALSEYLESLAASYNRYGY